MALKQEIVSDPSIDDELDEEEIVERIFQAVVEQRLPPGTKLSESALCEAFGVGRMRIRRSLLLLSSRQVVDLQANRGAYVASPTTAQAREVFETRQALEPAIVQLALQRTTDADIEALEDHLKAEHDAHAADHRHEAIRLSGQFHLMLAQIANNAIMFRLMKELVMRTSLIIGIYGAPSIDNCHDTEHAQITAAFKARDADAAARLMVQHLNHIAAQLNLDRKADPSVSLQDLFGKKAG